MYWDSDDFVGNEGIRNVISRQRFNNMITRIEMDIIFIMQISRNGYNMHFKVTLKSTLCSFVRKMDNMPLIITFAVANNLPNIEFAQYC